MNFINYQTPNEFRSRFNPVVGFSSDVSAKVNAFIENRVRRFFTSIGQDYDEAEFIELDETITDKEFQNTSAELANSYFYQFLFTETEKTNDGSISEPIKFAITFDRDLTPLSIDNITYGTIKIANRPILFYILFDLQELIRISKS